MTSAPLPLPRCGGRRLGFGAVMSLVIVGMVLLPPVSGGGVKGLKCWDGTTHKLESCAEHGADDEWCCFRNLKTEVRGCRSKCPDVCVTEAKEITACFCTKDECNKDENPWKCDPLYNKLYGTKPGPECSGSSKVVVSVLLVVVSVLGSLPHLITALF